MRVWDKYVSQVGGKDDDTFPLSLRTYLLMCLFSFLKQNKKRGRALEACLCERNLSVPPPPFKEAREYFIEQDATKNRNKKTETRRKEQRKSERV